jgi:hypothetical protein
VKRVIGVVVVLGLCAGVAARPASSATTTVGPKGVIAIDGAPTFPIALLKPPPLDGATPWGMNGLDEVVGAGVNLLGAGPFGVPWTEADLDDARAWNGAAAARGVHTWVNLRELARAAPGSADDTMLRRVVATLRDDPGLALWKSVDEPFHGGLTPELLRYPYDVTRALDPAHLSFILQAPRGTAADLAPYSSVTDVHSVDIYPVRYRDSTPDLHEVGVWTHRIRSATPNRAVWTTLGACFSGSPDPKGSGAIRQPTRGQQRYMVYDAILNGARGIIVYGNHLTLCLDPATAPLGWNWSYWRNVLRPVIAEIGPRGDLYPALLRPGSGIHVRSGDSQTQAVSRRVGSEVWVIAARRGPGTRTVRIHGLPRSVRSAQVYKERRRVPVRDGVLADRFARWGVHVYRLRLP